MHEYIDLIDKQLAVFDARRISTEELTVYPHHAFGWFVRDTLPRSDKEVTLALLIRDSFPYSIPAIFVVEPKLAPLEYPHVENDGKLCVWSSSYIVETSNSYILELLADAFALLDKAFIGELVEDFRDEFLNYWHYHEQASQSFISLCNPDNRYARDVVTYKSRSLGVIFADSEQEIINYLDNVQLLPQNGKRRKRKLSAIQKCTLLCFGTAWHPEEYPKTAKDLFIFLESNYPSEAETLIGAVCFSLSNSFTSTPSVLLSFETNNGICFAALEFSKGLFHKHKYRTSSALDGFRDNVPTKHLRTRVSNISVRAGQVNRNDVSWVMGRDVNHNWHSLKNDRVSIIGCGSVGAAVSRLLIQSGVQEIVLFDHESLKSENVSRHILGLQYDGTSKSEALSLQLRREFPHVKVHAINSKWQEAIENSENMKLLERSDLILSCTADWLSDQRLLRLQTELTLATIVFAYVEAHAMAAHVIVNPVNSNAFNSLHYTSGENVGKMLTPVTNWKESTIIRIPACAGEFQPYGVIPLTHLHAITADIALSLMLSEQNEDLVPKHIVWFEARKRLHELGGEWSNAWCKKYGDPGYGKYEHTYALKDGHWISQQ